MRTSATSNASSSFCWSVSLLSWTPFSSVPMYGVTSSTAVAKPSSDALAGSAKKARSRAGTNSLSASWGGLYASTAGVIAVPTRTLGVRTLAMLGTACWRGGFFFLDFGRFEFFFYPYPLFLFRVPFADLFLSLRLLYGQGSGSRL